MNLTLRRQSVNEEVDALFGKLYLDGQFECFTLERLSKSIPAGEYPIFPYFSPHNHRLVPQIMVPGRNYIEIHIANYPAQLEGCVAVGTAQNRDSLDHSHAAFESLMNKLGNTMHSVSIEVIDPA